MKTIILILTCAMLCSCGNNYFKERVNAVYQSEISQPEFSKKQTTENVLHCNTMYEQPDSFVIDHQPEVITQETRGIQKYIPNLNRFKKQSDSHNECMCAGKSMIMTGSSLMLMGVLTFFSWTTLGIGAFIVGAILLTVGIILVKKWR